MTGPTDSPPPRFPRRPGPRILFLDDDPGRAEAFLAGNPEAVWVTTVQDCLTRLEEPWDEVHLDHDLGGEHFVDFEREDCGMAIVRWLCLSPRPHLKPTRFIVHSHNPSAATLMVMQMHASGFKVEGWSFGSERPWFRNKGDDEREGRGFVNALRAALRVLMGRDGPR